MSDNKVGTYKFVAEPFHCDFTGKLTMRVLGNRECTDEGRTVLSAAG